MKINLKARFKNPVFIFQLVISILMPVMTYMGLKIQDLTSWPMLFSVIKAALLNPYVLGMIIVSVWNALNDPTTAGLSDSELALTYSKPKKDR